VTVVFDSRLVGVPVHGRRVHISACIDFASVDDGLLARIARTAATLPESGCLHVVIGEGVADIDAGEPLDTQLRLSGDLACLRLLDANTGGQPLFDPTSRSSITTVICPMEYERTVGLIDHLISASRIHPQSETSLSVQSNYDEDIEQLELILSGSLYATSYLLLIIALRLTQARS
jgi:hypothetical protein